jgi:hypothetical protein
MKHLIPLILLLVSVNGMAQESSDTLNQYNSKHKKNGYWICYIDSNFNLSSQKDAKYYGYEYYDNGKNHIKNYFKAKWRTKYDIEYKPNSSIKDSNGLILVDGEVMYSENDTVYNYEVFRNGIPVMNTQYIYHEYQDDSVKIEPYESIYFDSVYNGKRESALLYGYDDGKPFSKEYFPRPSRKSEPTYLVPVTKYGPIHRPRIGYYYQRESFLELGYSFRNTGGVIDENRTYHLDNDNFGGFTVSMLGNFGDSEIFGQKAVFTYNFMMLVTAELGIVNYTNFDFNTNDTRITLGTGITLGGRFSIMYHYYLPLASNHFTNIARHSVGIVLF